MLQVGLDRLGDWNPQLFRELKGRWTLRNLLLAIVISVGVQLVFLLYYWGQLPTLGSSHKYCTGPGPEYSPGCLTDALGHTLINWPLWSLDAFIGLSAIAMLVLPVVGTYLLVSDLDREERRGTLNFLRLTPQSASSLLVGKLLGVPILLYGAALLTVPLHFWLGSAAGISVALIFSFHGAILASCLCFYSAALLFGLVSTGLGGFQPWLGSGALLFLLITSISRNVEQSPLDLVTMLTPILVLAQMLPEKLLSQVEWYQNFASLQWFGLPIGSSWFNAFSFTVLNYGLWSFWAWQGIQRRFRNPNISLWSKRQSYGLTFCFEALVLGLALPVGQITAMMRLDMVSNSEESEAYRHLVYTVTQQFNLLMLLNLVFFLGLIGALLPHRQTVQDWARYRRERSTSRSRFRLTALMTDLLWSEKSPAVLAIAANLAIAATLTLVWLLSWPLPVVENRNQAIVGLLFSCGMLAVYAVLAQLLLLMPSAKRGMWTLGVMGAVVVLPVVVLAILTLEPSKAAGLWLFSAFPAEAARYASTSELLLGWLGQLSLIGLFSLQLTRQVRQIGASDSKALLSDRSQDRASLPRSV